MYYIEPDRYPARKVWLGCLSDTVNGLEVKARVRMKPRMLKVAEDRWVRVDIEEILFIERHPDGRGIWHTLRGNLFDLDASSYEESLIKARRAGVFVTISERHSISPSRILGVQLHKKGNHTLELEGVLGEPMELALEPRHLKQLEEVLEAINLGGGFLITGPELPEEDFEDY